MMVLAHSSYYCALQLVPSFSATRPAVRTDPESLFECYREWLCRFLILKFQAFSCSMATACLQQEPCLQTVAATTCSSNPQTEKPIEVNDAEAQTPRKPKLQVTGVSVNCGSFQGRHQNFSHTPEKRLLQQNDDSHRGP